MNDWVFIEDPNLRDQCDYRWTLRFYRHPDNQLTVSTTRCRHDGKWRRGEEYRCGYHTPGIGRKKTDEREKIVNLARVY